MENVIRSRPKRSLTRRLLAPIASLVLLAGGGWGAYQFYDADQDVDEQVIAVDSASSAKDELRMLFASEEPSAAPPLTVAETAPVEETKAPKKTLAKVDRYANVSVEPAKMTSMPPELPPSVSESTPAKQAALGNRYATALTTGAQQSSAEKSPALESPATQPAKIDVARGQEPNTNPLRATGSLVVPSDLGAREAFGEAPTQSPKTEASNPFAPAQPGTNGDDELASALQQARPLQVGQHPPNLARNRYQAPASLPPGISTTPQNRRPAPPIAIQSPPQRQLPSIGASPLGTPPVGLRTNSVQAQPPSAADYSSVPQSLTPTPGLANHPGTGRPGESLLEGVQSPSIMIQKLAPEGIQVGKRCTFAIRVQNSGQRTAHQVQIHDEVPLGTELVGTAPRATVSG